MTDIFRYREDAPVPQSPPGRPDLLIAATVAMLYGVIGSIVFGLLLATLPWNPEPDGTYAALWTVVFPFFPQINGFVGLLRMAVAMASDDGVAVGVSSVAAAVVALPVLVTHGLIATFAIVAARRIIIRLTRRG